MVFIAVASFLLAATGNGTNIFLLFAGLGGLSGIAALAKTFFDYHRGNQSAKVEDKSVAITELEKAVPGLGDIIEQWQAVVHQQQADKEQLRADLDDCRRRVAELEGGEK